MATRISNVDGGASALPILLAAIPSLPRPLLDRLVARMIDHMDELDGDADLEDGDEDEAVEDGPEGFDPEEDCCPAGDDRIFGGTVPAISVLYGGDGIGSDEDEEDDGQEVRLPHRRRVQRTRCVPQYARYAGRVEVRAYALRKEPAVPTLATWRRRHPRLRRRR